MMFVLLVLITLGVYAILGVVLWIAILLVRRLKPHKETAIPHLPHTFRAQPYGFFAVWEWRDCRWRMISDNLPDGVEPGAPPAYPGAFDGEIVKTWASGKRP